MELEAWETAFSCSRMAIDGGCIHCSYEDTPGEGGGRTESCPEGCRVVGLLGCAFGRFSTIVLRLGRSAGLLFRVADGGLWVFGFQLGAEDCELDSSSGICLFLAVREGAKETLREAVA